MEKDVYGNIVPAHHQPDNIVMRFFLLVWYNSSSVKVTVYQLACTSANCVVQGMRSLPHSGNMRWPDQPYNFLRRTFPELSDAGLRLLNALLTYDPDQRMTAQQALTHEYFRVSCQSGNQYSCCGSATAQRTADVQPWPAHDRAAGADTRVLQGECRPYRQFVRLAMNQLLW
jgi:serine/threonine protein kinase